MTDITVVNVDMSSMHTRSKADKVRGLKRKQAASPKTKKKQSKRKKQGPRNKISNAAVVSAAAAEPAAVTPTNKIILLLGFTTRKMARVGLKLPADADRCTTDELRVASLQCLLNKDTQVMTVNKEHKHPANTFHFAADFNTPRWIGRFKRHLKKLFPEGVEVTDVYLDYYNLRPSWYRESYGTQWPALLSGLPYTGRAYLPVSNLKPEEPYAGVLRASPGEFITDIDTLILCRAASLVDADLATVNPAAIHEHQAKSISGYVSFTPKQAKKWLKESSGAVTKKTAKKTATKTPTKKATKKDDAAETTKTPTKETEKNWSLEVTLDAAEYAFAVRVTTGPKYSFIVPKGIAGGRRGYIHFSRCTPFGDNLYFGSFLQRQVDTLVSKWKKTHQARSWFADKRKTWKADVVKMWGQKRHRPTRKNTVDMTAAAHMTAAALTPTMIDLTQDPSQVVYATKSTGHTIALPDFREFRTSKTKNEQWQTIRVVPGTRTRKKDGSPAYLAIPGVLLDQPKGEKYSMGKEHGCGAAWMKFVAEKVEYAVQKWQNIGHARRFVKNRKRFVKLVQDLWATCVDADPELCIDRHWEIRRSTLPVDERYLKAKIWPESARWNKGSGLWCVKPGKHRIFFTGPAHMTIRTAKKPSKKQGHYMAKVPKSKKRVMPSMQCFVLNIFHHSFIVGHKRDPEPKPAWPAESPPDGPTHYPDYQFGLPCLSPWREAVEGEEYCFDYGYLNPDVEDVSCTEDNSEDSAEKDSDDEFTNAILLGS
jgi:hypothetical protein